MMAALWSVVIGGVEYLKNAGIDFGDMVQILLY